MVDVSGTTSWNYDQRGHVTSKTQVAGGLTLTATWAYSATNGHLTTLTYPSGSTQTFSYNSNGQISSTSPLGGTVSNIIWQPFGPVAGWLIGSTSTYSRVYNGDGTISQILLKGSSTANSDSLGYSYDNAGRITQLVTPTATLAYDYDEVDHVISYAVNGTTQQSFDYDENGNRIGMTATAGSTTYTISATSNRLASLSGLVSQTNTWDTNGNLTALTQTGSTTSFGYDSRERLRWATNGLGQTATYSVNDLGQRVVKKLASLGGGTNVSYFDDAGKLLGLYDGTGTRVQEYSWLGDANDAPGQAIPINVTQPGLVQYINTDHLNAPRTVTYASGSQRWRWDHGPFGEEAPNQNPNGLGTYNFDWRFPGQTYDSETGASYNMFRDSYFKATGGYGQSDPIGLAGSSVGSMSTYPYAAGNPVEGSDPSGLQAMPMPMVPHAGPMSTPNQSSYLTPGTPEYKYAQRLGNNFSTNFSNLCDTLGNWIDTISRIGEGIDNASSGQSAHIDSHSREQNCQELKNSILSTCASLTGRKKFACFAAAQATYEQCVSE